MKTAVRAAALPTLLADAPPTTRILSLDCFDTLIWRNVQAPTDVFADLAFAGGGIEARALSEVKARRTIAFVHGREDVTIAEIYAALMPNADAATVNAAIAAELAAEARHCFAFAPTRDLILDAKRRGLDVIIVSDTYLSEPQLRGLIEAVAGKDLADLIDRIFCSCEYGVGKAGGLFAHVLADLGASPFTIVHVGDNRVADVAAPAKLGVNTVHFEQFDEEAEQRLRLEAAAAVILDPATRRAVPAYQPHRAQISLRENSDPAFTLGHDVLGPIMHGFALWVRDEALAMETRTGKPVKLLFLLRDGHLPFRSFVEACPAIADRAHAVEISRFTAMAASFTDAAAIERYLGPEMNEGQIEVLGKQLLLNDAEIARISAGATKVDFFRAVLEPASVRKIVQRSAEFRQRLFAHLGKHGVERGDAVMLVDLGYNGSVQNAAEDYLRDGMNLDVAGRYLLLREHFQSGLDKRGYMDTRHHDLKALNALCESIAIVEQLCTLAQGSVVDYRPNGTPVRSRTGLKSVQSDTRDRAQDACIAFVTNAGQGVVRAPASDDADCRRRMAGAALTRLLFLPTDREVALFETFHHDVNLGSEQTMKIIDTAAAAQGLRRRGLFYVKNALRAYLPGELRNHGLPLNLSILSTSRFGLDLRKSDFDVGAIKLPVLLMDAGGHIQIDVNAHPTADGYYQALIPVGAGQYTSGIQFGQICEWVQIEEASFHDIVEYMTPKPDEGAIAATPMFDSMEEMSPGLYRAAEAGFAFVPPPAPTGEPMMLSIVFRPLVARSAQAGAARIAA